MRVFSLFTILSFFTAGAVAQEVRKPRLVVNLVVSQLRYDYLVRYANNLSNDGFRRFIQQGISFEECRYNYMPTNSPAGLATITTGTDPAIHGVIGDQWIDFTNNRIVSLIEDSHVRGLDTEAAVGRYSSMALTVPVLGEQLLEENPKSKVISVAADPVSAVVLGGQTSQVFWMDTTSGNWISSSGYMTHLPSWVRRYNNDRYIDSYAGYVWRPMHNRDIYRNTAYSVMDVDSQRRPFWRRDAGKARSAKYQNGKYSTILLLPPGITLVNDFVKHAIVNEDLGKDEHPDLLNICFDTPRYVGQLFGGESMESEDLLYRMDRELGDLIDFIFAQIPQNNVLFVLTSDHGASNSFDRGGYERERFNPMQFRLIMNGFLNAQYGNGEWVIAYRNRQLYLNHVLIYSNNLDLREVQDRAAAFALQFRGVSHVATGTALQSGYFGDGYGQKIQNGYYPKRSGDLTINLMPGWIEEDDAIRSMSGSMYDYDTHVPLCWLGAGLPTQRVRAPADPQQVTPTLARIMGIHRPEGATGKPLEAVVSFFE